MIFKYIVTAVCAYLLGSISFSVLLSKLIGGDVRKKGSGNAGATNMARIYGLLAGLLTLAFDALKAAASILIGQKLLGDVGLAIAGIMCLLGHCFPVFFGFKGGKGVSVGVAVAYFIGWRIGLILTIVFFIVVLLTKKVSLGSCAAALSISFAAVIFHVSTPKLVLALFGMLLVIWQHRENLKRALAGTEPDFKLPKHTIGNK